MKERTPQREERMRQVLARRQHDLSMVINNIHDPHNVSAVLRSCDAFGVHRVHLYYTREKFPVLGHGSSASAKKWVERQKHDDPQAMIDFFHAQGMQCVGTGFSETATPLDRFDLTRPTAIVLGNEHRGLDQDLFSLLDGELYIPMQGMVQSLNVSVAAAIILYEAWRQRFQAGMYDRTSLSEEETGQILAAWSEK